MTTLTTRTRKTRTKTRRKTRQKTSWQLNDWLCFDGWIRRCLDVKSCSFSLSLSRSLSPSLPPSLSLSSWFCGPWCLAAYISIASQIGETMILLFWDCDFSQTWLGCRSEACGSWTGEAGRCFFPLPPSTMLKTLMCLARLSWHWHFLHLFTTTCQLVLVLASCASSLDRTKYLQQGVVISSLVADMDGVHAWMVFVHLFGISSMALSVLVLHCSQFVPFCSSFLGLPLFSPSFEVD